MSRNLSCRSSDFVLFSASLSLLFVSGISFRSLFLVSCFVRFYSISVIPPLIWCNLFFLLCFADSVTGNSWCELNDGDAIGYFSLILCRDLVFVWFLIFSLLIIWISPLVSLLFLYVFSVKIVFSELYHWCLNDCWLLNYDLRGCAISESQFRNRTASQENARNTSTT